MVDDTTVRTSCGSSLVGHKARLVRRRWAQVLRDVGGGTTRGDRAGPGAVLLRCGVFRQYKTERALPAEWHEDLTVTPLLYSTSP